MKAFTFTHHSTVSGVEITCEGTLDERANLPSLHMARGQKTYMNLKDVSFVNSKGISIWINWLKQCFKSDPKLKLFLKNCPKVIVDQINSVRGFCPSRVTVDSVYVPYHCEGCQLQEFVLLQRGTGFSYETGEVAGQRVPCPKCGRTMEIDILPQKYFSFLKNKF